MKVNCPTTSKIHHCANRDLFFFQKSFILPTKQPSPSEMSGNVWQAVSTFYNRKVMLMCHLTTILETFRCKILLITDCSCDSRRLFGHSNHPHYGANRYTSTMSTVNISILYSEIMNAKKNTSRKSRYHVLCNILLKYNRIKNSLSQGLFDWHV